MSLYDAFRCLQRLSQGGGGVRRYARAPAGGVWPRAAGASRAARRARINAARPARLLPCHPGCSIRGSEVGPDQRTNIISVANLLQEAASNHAVALWGRSDEGFANDPAMGGLIFVMTRQQIQVERYPRW